MGIVTRFCSGAVTPNNTIIVGEESTTSGNINSTFDSYEDRGWLIEIDPATRTVINQDGVGGTDKLWAAGRQSHENAVIKSDNTVMYWGADASSTGYVYKFIPTVPGNFSSGTLYVLQTTASLGSGTWKVVANSTITQRNNTVSASTSAGAYNFNGVEDVEIGPDGKIYFAAKGQGKVYRFTDNNTVGTATDITGLEVFVGNSNHPTIVSYDVDGAGPLGTQSWGTGNDNLAFDGEGNLWVLNDGGGGHIWVVSPTHTQASPQVRLFARTPSGGEPTGITFTPNYRYMFISFQHPAAAGSQTDATGTSVTFNTHTTVVIARTEHLGPGSTLPVNFLAFDAKLAGEGATINWTVTDISNHDYFEVERSTDGIHFDPIHRNSEDINGAGERAFTITDYNLPSASSIFYYRIKQCDKDGRCRYTEVRTVKTSRDSRIMRVFPQPVSDKINIVYNSLNAGEANLSITDINGQLVYKETRNLIKGVQTLELNTNKFSNGIYMLTVTDVNYNRSSHKFIKGQ